MDMAMLATAEHFQFGGRPVQKGIAEHGGEEYNGEAAEGP